MTKNNPGSREQWLHGEIAGWQRDGLIDANQAEQITSRYPAPKSVDDGWGKVIFAAIGAMIFGLGVILIFAYNWQGMHRYTKLAVVMAALLLTHGAGFALNRADGRQRKLGESFHLLGTILFGAGIWLVAQIYHIDEHYPNAYFAWSLGALALAWAMPSVAQGMLAVALVFMWTWFKAFDFHHLVHWGPALIAFGVLPLAWLQRSRALLAAGLCVFLLVYAFSLAQVDDGLIVSALLIWSGAMLGSARLAQESAFSLGAPIIRGIGNTVFLVLLFALSFSGVAGDVLDKVPEGAVGWFYITLPMLFALGSWGISLVRGMFTQSGHFSRTEDAIVLLLLLQVMIASVGVEIGALIWVSVNLAILGLGAIYIVRGMRLLRWRQLALGCVLIAAEVFARFMDLFDSLLARSVVFLVLGAALIGVGAFFSRQKQREPVDA